MFTFLMHVSKIRNFSEAEKFNPILPPLPLPLEKIINYLYLDNHDKELYDPLF